MRGRVGSPNDAKAHMKPCGGGFRPKDSVNNKQPWFDNECMISRNPYYVYWIYLEKQFERSQGQIFGK